MRTLTIEKLTRESFEPFGDVVQTEGAKHFMINDGTTERFHDLAKVETDGGRTLINLFRSQPRQLPFTVTMLERHPLGSQAFIPLTGTPYLIVAAPAGELDPSRVRAFVSDGWQGVNYAPGVWHHPLMALERVSEFIVVDRGGEGHNCDEQTLAEPLWLVQEALEEARAEARA